MNNFRRNIHRTLIAATAVAVATLPAYRAFADDETDDVEIKLVAPLDATDCAATPATITVLGLAIDVSAARIETQSSGGAGAVSSPILASGGDDGEGHNGRHGGDVTPNCPTYYGCTTQPTPVPTPVVSGCAALVVGQIVEVELASDNAPLKATQVKQGGGDTRIKIEAPIQAVSADGLTLTVLGLNIGIGAAELNGTDDHGDDNANQPIDASELMVGAFVEVRLASNAAPLTATELELKNFSNQVEVEVEDAHGQHINDVDRNGSPVNSVQVDVLEAIVVAPAGSTPQHVRKLVHFHSTSNGRFTLCGLPTGRARIVVSRVHDGVTELDRRNVTIRGDRSSATRVRLRAAHH